MQEEWWYSNKDARKGPVPITGLRQLLIEGVVTTSTLVWKEGMTTWAPIAEVPELNQIARSLPPELPRLPKTDGAITLSIAGPWRRFLARMIDLWVIMLPTALLIAYLVPSISSDLGLRFAQWLQKPGSDYAFAWFLTPAVLVIEGAIFAITGTTLGKWLLGIKITTASDQPLTAKQYLQRQIGIYWYGLGTGFPLASLFTMAIQHGRIKSKKPARYDVDRYTVRASQLGILRIIVVVLVAGSLIGINGVLRIMSNKPVHEANPSKTGAFDDLIPNSPTANRAPRDLFEEAGVTATKPSVGMSKFIMTTTDGQQYVITAPEGTSQEEAMDYARKQLSREEWEKLVTFDAEPTGKTDTTKAVTKWWGKDPIVTPPRSGGKFGGEYVTEDEVFGRSKTSSSASAGKP